jgi:predicted ABC-type ATPase
MSTPRMFIVAGPPGAGKSSIFSLQNFASQVFNADDRAAEMNAGSYRDIPLHVRRAVNQEFERFVHANIAKKQSFALETTLRSKITFEQAQLAKSQGFDVLMTYVALNSFEKHLERVKQRAFLGGHAASEATLRGIYEHSMANLPIALNPGESGIQFLRVFDNSAFQAQPSLALEAHNGRVVRIAQKFPEWLKNVLGWTDEHLMVIDRELRRPTNS